MALTEGIVSKDWFGRKGIAKNSIFILNAIFILDATLVPVKA
jgi:hypothetical protein